MKNNYAMTAHCFGGSHDRIKIILGESNFKSMPIPLIRPYHDNGKNCMPNWKPNKKLFLTSTTIVKLH